MQKRKLEDNEQKIIHDLYTSHFAPIGSNKALNKSGYD